MTNGKFLLSTLITLAIACLIVGSATGFVHVLLVIGIYSALFYIGLKISSAVNAMMGANYDRDAALIYDIILLMITSLCFGLYAGLT